MAITCFKVCEEVGIPDRGKSWAGKTREGGRVGETEKGVATFTPDSYSVPIRGCLRPLKGKAPGTVLSSAGSHAQAEPGWHSIIFWKPKKVEGTWLSPWDSKALYIEDLLVSVFLSLKKS